MFNAGLKDIKDNGTYDEIITKYLGEDAVPADDAETTEEAAEDDAAETPEATEEAAE